MSRRFALGVLTAGFTLSAMTGALYAAGLRVNTSPSVPVGLWLLETPTAVARGQVVTICPPATLFFVEAARRGYFRDGRCPSGYEPLLKPVVAVPSDTVEVTSAAVLVNGQALPNSAPERADPAGRPMPLVPSGPHGVPPGMVWVLSTYNPQSFDSRYFAALPAANITAVAHPVWVWP